MEYKAFAHTVTGISHTKHGKDCEDASFGKDFADQSVSIAVVADGHGDDNCFRSATGSKFAVDCAKLGIYKFVKYLNEPEVEDTNPIEEAKSQTSKPEPRKKLFSKEELETSFRKMLIEKGIIPSWFKTVADHFEKNPLTEDELKKASDKYRKRYLQGERLHHAYGTTLIAAAITPDYWFGIHIGDGRFTALYPDGSFDQPVPWDDRCNLNVTTSICDDDSAETARCYFSMIDVDHPVPVAIFLCSDGIDDNYPVYENEKHLFKLYRTIALCFAEEGFESAGNQLKDLIKKFANEGKGDDTSIGVLIDIEGLEQIVPVWKGQVAEEERKSAEEKAAAESAKPASKAQPETEKRQTEDSKELAVEKARAIAAYEKQMDSPKKDALSYGDFATLSQRTGETEKNDSVK